MKSMNIFVRALLMYFYFQARIVFFNHFSTDRYYNMHYLQTMVETKTVLNIQLRELIGI